MVMIRLWSLDHKGRRHPLGFVKVYVINEEGDVISAPTDRNGWARFNLADGNYRIKVRDMSHQPHTKKYWVSRHSIIEIALNRSY